ncbi:MAG: outer membrane beta-barrel protein [Flavobacteriales bacterium]
MSKFFWLLLLLSSFFGYSQDLKGIVVDRENNAISFATVLLFEKGDSVASKGTATNDDGSFSFQNLKKNEYSIQFSMIGFKSKTLQIVLPRDIDLKKIILEEDLEKLDETIITVKKPTIKREPGKLIFNVENTSLSSGDIHQLLKKTPGVILLGDAITIKKTPAVIYINNKRVYLSSSELASLLKSMDAANIKSIEVITNPSSKYDANVKSVLNIVTSKAVSIGYKGSINTTYEQGVFSKYKFSTTHFYKNNWLNLYANYGFSPRKEFKQDDNYIRFINPDGNTMSIYNSDFQKTTHSQSHQGILIADFNLNDKNRLSFTSNILVSPKTEFDTTIQGEILNSQQSLDSTFNTLSFLNKKTANLDFNLEHQWQVSNKSNLTSSVQFIDYQNEQNQDLKSIYWQANGDFIRDFSFFTNADQDTKIYTARTDFGTSVPQGDLETGFKYSRIDTKTGYDFFDIINNQQLIDPLKSDQFNYREDVAAAYFTFVKKWEKWSINAGIRGEYTYVKTNSIALSLIEKQHYANFFPSISFLFDKDKNNHFEASYKRSIVRPKYQALNPFTYFITDNILAKGNPDLVPTIKNKFLLGYYLKNKWAFETYVIYADNPLGQLSFQNNTNNTTQTLDANIISDLNFSVDISHNSYVLPWWYLYVYTSGYYLENVFYALQSEQDTYINHTLGFYVSMYSNISLSKDKTFTSDIDLSYLSHYVTGASLMKNQFNLSVSLRKTIWKKRASITVGVDDIFNTHNIPVTTKYYNQDNSYFAKAEAPLFRLGFKYNFGNYKLRNNKRIKKTDEKDRLE